MPASQAGSLKRAGNALVFRNCWRGCLRIDFLNRLRAGFPVRFLEREENNQILFGRGMLGVQTASCPLEAGRSGLDHLTCGRIAHVVTSPQTAQHGVGLCGATTATVGIALKRFRARLPKVCQAPPGTATCVSMSQTAFSGQHPPGPER